MKVGVTVPSKEAETGGRVYSAPALEKGLDIIELLCASEAPLSQKDIAHRLGRTVGEIYRMLASLVSRNYVALVDENYCITTKLFELAQVNPPMHRLLREAVPVMHKLASEVDQSCHLTVQGRGCQIVIAKVDAPTGMGYSVRVGSELDSLISVSGRVLLAFQDPETQALRIDEALQRRPEQANPKIGEILSLIRERGYDAVPSVQVRGLFAVSFPILDSQGHAIAAMTVPYAERIDQSQPIRVTDVQEALGMATRLLTLRMVGRLPQTQPAPPSGPAVLKRRSR
jgi:DNA-binding IclR family transcriptional regulator